MVQEGLSQGIDSSEKEEELKKSTLSPQSPSKLKSIIHAICIQCKFPDSLMYSYVCRIFHIKLAYVSGCLVGVWGCLDAV